MPLYDARQGSEPDDRARRARAARASRQALHAPDDRRPPARGRAGGRRRGRQLRRQAPARVHRRRAPRPDRRATRSTRSRSSSPSQPGYRTWGLESAALDLALRQAGRSLADAVGRDPQPVRFVVSQSDGARAGSTLYPALRFKLDASDSWTDEVVAELAATGAVDVVDLKGLYEGDWIDATPSAELYGRVAEAFPEALARGPAPERRDQARCSSRTASGSRGTSRSTPSRTSRRSRFPPRVPELEAVALRLGSAALRLLRLLRRARDRASTAAASSSSGRVAARSSTSRPSSIRMRRTTSRRGSTTRAARRPGLPQSPLPAASREPGFR